MRTSPVSRPIKEYSIGFLVRAAILIVVILLYLATPEANLWLLLLLLSVAMGGYAYWLKRENNWFMMTMMGTAAVLNLFVTILCAFGDGAPLTKIAVLCLLFVDMVATPNRRQEPGPRVHERYRV